MTAIAETKAELKGGPKLETGGTANITTTAHDVMRVRGDRAAVIRVRPSLSAARIVVG